MVDPIIAYARPLNSPPNVNHVVNYKLDGPFNTKTGANLYVAWVLPLSTYGLGLPRGISLESFLEVNKAEESLLINNVKTRHPKFNQNIRGDRFYFQKEMKAGSPKAGNEFHRIRRELAFPITGKINFKFEDVYGNEKETDLVPGQAVIIPPFIMHTLTFLEDSSLGVRANTLFFFDHEGKRIEIPDSYSRESFDRLKGYFKH